MFSVSQQGLRTLKSGNYLYKISLSTDVLNFMFEVLARPIEFFDNTCTLNNKFITDHQ